MMNFHFSRTKTMLACAAFVALALPNFASVPPRTIHHQTSKGMAAAYPWVFKNGTDTAEKTALDAVAHVAKRAGYAPVPADVAEAAWTTQNLPEPAFGSMPSRASLVKFGKALHVSRVIYGSVSWHTRSIWVNVGPKTISTATVNVYVLNVATGKVIYSKKGVQGRSDEKSQAYKIALDVLATPLVTAVSGGPMTPQQQRAVQIAMGNAFRSWVRSSRK